MYIFYSDRYYAVLIFGRIDVFVDELLKLQQISELTRVRYLYLDSRLAV